jgi:hypothetical protein
MDYYNYEKQKITDDDVYTFWISDEWVYYIPQVTFCIKKVRVDGSERQQITKNLGCLFNVSHEGDWLYYIDEEDGNKIYRILTDGTGCQKVTDDCCESLKVTDGWVYYNIYAVYNNHNNNGIYRVRTNGKDRQKICDENDFDPYITDGWLYYTSGNPEEHSLR